MKKKMNNRYLEDYWEEIKSEKTLVSNALKLQLSKLIDDIDNKRYVFDTTDADKRIDFIENCIRLTKSPFYGKPMKLFLFQKAFITALYSFKMADGSDRFQRALYLIARKNGKSELCSALALTELIIGGQGQDIVCSSNNDTQANILYQAVDDMRVMLDPDSVDTWRNQSGIKCFLNNSRIFKLSERTRNKEGRNIDFAVCDECHELKQADIIKSIEQSQSLKTNPKLIIITTEGFVNDGFLDKELIRARGILNDEIIDKASERYLVWLYEQDSENEVWQSKNAWQKSNPTLGQVKKVSYLEQQVDLARYSKADRVFVLSKDFNIKQSNAEAWLKQEDVLKCDESINLEDFRGAVALGAVDLAETTDLTSAKIILIKPNDNRKYIYSMYWIPDGKLTRADDRTAGADYEGWANKGLLRISNGNYIDTSVVADWFYELYDKYGIRTLNVGYDSRFASEFINKMDFYGFETTNIWQRPEILNAPIKMCEMDILDNLVCGLNEIDKWCLNNASLKVDNKGLAILEKIKGQHSRKIDGAVTLVMCYEMLRRNADFKEAING